MGKQSKVQSSKARSVGASVGMVDVVLQSRRLVVRRHGESSQAIALETRLEQFIAGSRTIRVGLKKLFRQRSGARLSIRSGLSEDDLFRCIELLIIRDGQLNKRLSRHFAWSGTTVESSRLTNVEDSGLIDDVGMDAGRQDRRSRVESRLEDESFGGRATLKLSDDPAKDARSLAKRLRRPIDLEDVAALQRIVNAVFENPPTTKKVEFVDNFNFCLDALGCGILIRDGRIARLCLKPASEKGSIQFSVPSDSVGRSSAYPARVIPLPD